MIIIFKQFVSDRNTKQFLSDITPDINQCPYQDNLTKLLIKLVDSVAKRQHETKRLRQKNNEIAKNDFKGSRKHTFHI